MNIRLDIEYDGEPFQGWQRQKNHASIQATIEDLLGKILKRRVVLYGAGRTDGGVHARGQVANFFVNEQTSIPPEKWSLALNTSLPPQIRILRSRVVPDSFHSQKSAVSKIYEYRILNRNYSSALDRRVYFWPHHLNWDAVKKALPVFVGEHDFKSFQSGKPISGSTVRRILRFEMHESQSSEGLMVLQIEGTGFLRQMVRNIVGTVMEVGQELCEPCDISTILQKRDRNSAGRAAPARGLCLLKVNYNFDETDSSL